MTEPASEMTSPPLANIRARAAALGMPSEHLMVTVMQRMLTHFSLTLASDEDDSTAFRVAAYCLDCEAGGTDWVAAVCVADDVQLTLCDVVDGALKHASTVHAAGGKGEPA